MRATIRPHKKECDFVENLLKEFVLRAVTKVVACFFVSLYMFVISCLKTIFTEIGKNILCI